MLTIDSQELYFLGIVLLKSISGFDEAFFHGGVFIKKYI